MPSDKEYKDDFVKEIEEMAKDTAPKTKDARGRIKTEHKSEKKSAATAYRAKPLKPRIEQAATGVGMMVYIRCHTCGETIVEAAPNLAEAYTMWADQSPRVRATLERLLSGGAGTQAMLTTIMLCVTIASHHGIHILPEGMLKMFVPATPDEVSPNGSSAAVTAGADAPPVP